MTGIDPPASTDVRAAWPAGLGASGVSRPVLAAIAAGLALLYLAGVTGLWWPTPDSALYLGLGRSIAEGEGYRFNGQPHNLVSPGLPLILAALRMVAGEGFWAPNLLMCLLGLLAVFFIFRVFQQQAGTGLAAAVTVAVAMSYSFYLNAHRILSDMPFLAMFWIIIYAALRVEVGRRVWLVGVALLSVVGVAIRVPGLAALTALAGAMILQGGAKNRSLRPLEIAGALLASLTAVALGLLALAYTVQPTPPPYARIFMLHGNLSGYFAHFLWAISDLPAEACLALTGQTFAPLGVAFLALGVLGSVRLWRHGRRVWATLWVLYVLGLAFSCGAGSIRARYLLPIQPALTYAVLAGFCQVVGWLTPAARKAASSRVLSTWVLIFVGALSAMNVPKILRHAVWYSYLSHTPRYYQVIRDGRYAEMMEVARLLRERTPPRKTVAIREDLTILHFLSRQRMVAFPGPRSIAEANLRKSALIFHPDLAYLVLKTGEDPHALEVLRQAAAQPASSLREIFRGRHYEAFEVLPGARIESGSQRPAPGPQG